MRELTGWLKLMGGSLLLWLPVCGFGQALELNRVNELARANYPMIRQKDLINQTTGISISNLQKGFLPQLSINGQASYQSEVTRIDIPVPGINIEPLEKDQYKLTADVSQLLYDGGATRQQKRVQRLQGDLSDEQLESELYRLRQRVNQVFLGILLFDQQIEQIALVEKDLATGIRQVEARVNNGVAFRSDLNSLRAEQIRNRQRRTELRASRKSLIATLGLFINQELPEQTVLAPPDAPLIAADSIDRPEIRVFDNRNGLLQGQAGLIRSKVLPKASLFVQGGYGRPGLNLLQNQFDLFYIGGVRFNWALGGLYTNKNERRLIRIGQEMVSKEKETFLLNTRVELKQQVSEIEKLQQLIQDDNEIIGLRQSVTESARAQLGNNVITSADYLREVNAEDQARQQKILHELQLLQAKINYQTIIGN